MGQKTAENRNKPEIYPLGIAGGKIKILYTSRRELKCELVDLSIKMSGIYYLNVRDGNLFIKREKINNKRRCGKASPFASAFLSD